MPFLFTYLLKLSVSLAVVFLFYQFVLRKLTFYNWNRWYLLIYTLLCFFIPFIDISPVLQRNEWASHTALTWIPVIEEYPENEIVTDPAFSFFTLWNIISLVVVAGMLIMLLRLLIQLISFRRMMKKAKAIPCEGMNLYQVDEAIIPFSFGNSIFINQRLHTTEELQEIIRHEFVHVKQKHSIDIIWGELLCLVNWYNPFAWLLKRSIRQNLEFIADSKVLENGINKKQYQYLLLKVIGNNQFSIAPKFNFSSLKKRIAMMNKLKTARLHLVRFLFILPVLAVILLSFRKQIGDSVTQDKNKVTAIDISGDFTDTVPDVMELNDKGYYIDVKGKDGNCIVVVKDKNRKEVERVLLTKWKENQEYYDNLYGEILPPPPVPPMPPTPPTPPTDEYDSRKKAFLKRNPDVKDIGWLFNNVRENLVIEAHIFKKDGTMEKYELKDDADKAKAEKKYGELPLPIATPPTPPVILKMPDYVLQQLDRNAEFIEIWVQDGKKESYNLKVPAEKAAFEKKYGKIPEPPDPPTPPTPPVPSTKGADHKITTLQEINRTSISDDFEITDKEAVMRLKNGKVEKYDLANPKQRKKFEEKYGRIINLKNDETGVKEPFVILTGNSGQATLAAMNPSNDEIMVIDPNDIELTGKEDILITITMNTTAGQLETFKKQMKEKGIELRFDNINYNDGVLVSISGTMSSKDKHNNFVATDFNKLVISTVQRGEKIYFKVSVTDNKTVI